MTRRLKKVRLIFLHTPQRSTRVVTSVETSRERARTRARVAMCVYRGTHTTYWRRETAVRREHECKADAIRSERGASAGSAHKRIKIILVFYLILR